MSFEVISRTGAIEILKQLENSPKRFSELTQLNKQTKAKRLIELENSGLILRRVTSDRPIKVIYELTPKGMEVLKTLDQLEKKLK